MALFGGPEKKCILCGRNPGEFKHAAADGRFLCDNCAEECGYENEFFFNTEADEITLELVQKDHDAQELLIEKTRDGHKQFKTSQRLGETVLLDQSRLEFCCPSAVIPCTKLPVIYKYNQVLSCTITIDEGVLKRVRTSDPYEFEPQRTDLPIVDTMTVRISTSNPVRQEIIISLLDEPARKSTRKFRRAQEQADQIFEVFSAIIKSNQGL